MSIESAKFEKRSQIVPPEYIMPHGTFTQASCSVTATCVISFFILLFSPSLISTAFLLFDPGSSRSRRKVLSYQMKLSLLFFFSFFLPRHEFSSICCSPYSIAIVCVLPLKQLLPRPSALAGCVFRKLNNVLQVLGLKQHSQSAVKRSARKLACHE